MRPATPLDSQHLDGLVFQYIRRDFVPLRIDVTAGEGLSSRRHCSDWRRDPTIAAGPIVLALADLATLLFYFNSAGMLLAA